MAFSPKKTTAKVFAALALTVGLVAGGGALAPAHAAPYDKVITVEAGTPIYTLPFWQKPHPIEMGVCTLGAITASGWAITAGHCAAKGDCVFVERGANMFYQIGKMYDRSLKNGDFGIIKLAKGIEWIPSKMSFTTPSKGAAIYKLGTTSGRSSGTITSNLTTIDQLKYPILPGGLIGITYDATTRGQLANLCSKHGDSGGPIIDQRTDRVVGIMVGSAARTETASRTQCRPDAEALIAPLSLLSGKYRH